MSSSTSHTTAKLVDLQFEDLVAGKDLSKEIAEAYGPEGLGILIVSGVPNVEEFRKNLLTCGFLFGGLSEEVKQKYVHEASNFSFGWSHGKEIFNGKQDVLKGSFYANPQYDHITNSEEILKKYPFYASPNIWPKADMPELEGAFKAMGQLIVSVGKLIAKHCDAYMATLFKEEQKAASLHKIIDESQTCKARLLHYFPLSKEQIEEQGKSQDADSWCGWHLDHGSLTGLTNAMYFDKNTGESIQLKDENAGLYIRTRAGEVVKGKWRADQLAFQIGESSQIHTGGRLVATPHCVRGTTTPDVARVTFAVFMQPQWDVPMAPPAEVPLEDCKMDVLEKGMDFHDFTSKRLAQYYDAKM